MYIYKTTNTINGKIYIGKRVYRKKDDNWYIGSGILLKKAILKYGRNNFKKEIIEWCETEDILNKKEKFWIEYFNSTNLDIGYNLAPGGEGGDLGIESRRKISQKLKGIKKSEKVKTNMSNSMKGIPKSKEHVEKLRAALKDRKRPIGVVEKMSKSIKLMYKNGWQSPVQKPVEQYCISGNYINSFKSATEASRILKISRKGITNCCLGKTKTSGGYKWAFSGES